MGSLGAPQFCRAISQSSPRKVRQITRITIAVILVVGVLREETPWEILVLALWVGIYVEMVMRKPNELGSRPW